MQLIYLNFTCMVCKEITRKPGIGNKFCSYVCQSIFIKSLPNRKKKKRLLRRRERERIKYFGMTKKEFKRHTKEERKKMTPVHPQVGTDAFYNSREWLALRYRVLKKYGRRCMCCHRTDVELHVDHIKPISKFPMLALSEENLQVLCRQCNLGKSNKDMTDFRPVRGIVTEPKI